MTPELKKLEQDKLDSWRAYQKYMDDRKRPMTEDELIEHLKQEGTFDETYEHLKDVDSQSPEERPYIIEFKDEEDFQGMRDASDHMIDTHRIFRLAYDKWKENDNT